MLDVHSELITAGTVKNAWPEFQGGDVQEVQEQLKAQGVTVFLQEPHESTAEPPTDQGTAQDVWLYTNGGDGAQVQGIPVRGTWHPNRIQPGWPELVGTGFEKAIEMITVEQIGVKVVYGPDGFPCDKMIDRHRVFLDIDTHGNVARIPKLG
ncbi:hypothetical protein R1flu_028723 [Riccia fluitans]|uniref:Uncharacterized protein n=1 Tax=Riccia fluitans TaxID=41844 RepID=A0ABD1XN24_9MARC